MGIIGSDRASICHADDGEGEVKIGDLTAGGDGVEERHPSDHDAVGAGPWAARRRTQGRRSHAGQAVLWDWAMSRVARGEPAVSAGQRCTSSLRSLRRVRGTNRRAREGISVGESWTRWWTHQIRLAPADHVLAVLDPGR